MQCRLFNLLYFSNYKNVMLQMGLNLITVDGMRIRNIRQYVMKCHTCFKFISLYFYLYFRISKDMSKVFCPQCGNNTLIKISIQVDEKGNITHIQNTRRQLNLRGTKVCLLSFIYFLVPNSIAKRRKK